MPGNRSRPDGHSADGMAGVSGRRGAPNEMLRVLDGPPVAALDLSNRGAAIRVWRHGPLHDVTRPMADHVFMTYRGAPRSIERSTGSRFRRSATEIGTVTLIPAGEESRWDIDGDLDAVHFYVSPKRLQDVAWGLGFRGSVELTPRTADADETGAQLLTMLGSCGAAEGRVDRLFLEQVSNLIDLHLLRRHSGLATKGPVWARGGLTPSQLRAACETIDNRLADEISLQELAEAAGVSTSHFCRAFKQSTGVPPFRWRQLRRVERARELLDRSDLPVTEIAAMVGYDDPGHFSTAFRSVTNLSPLQYRRRG